MRFWYDGWNANGIRVDKFVNFRPDVEKRFPMKVYPKVNVNNSKRLNRFIIANWPSHSGLYNNTLAYMELYMELNSKRHGQRT